MLTRVERTEYERDTRQRTEVLVRVRYGLIVSEPPRERLTEESWSDLLQILQQVGQVDGFHVANKPEMSGLSILTTGL